jgi:hypothetical protein
MIIDIWVSWYTVVLIALIAQSDYQTKPAQ